MTKSASFLLAALFCISSAVAFPLYNLPTNAVGSLAGYFFAPESFGSPPKTLNDDQRQIEAAFTPGNIVVCRIGTGAAALSNSATEVFLDEYSPAGTLTQTISLPTAISGANFPLTLSGTATNECQISRSADGRYILIPGYPQLVGTLAVSSTAGGRVIGRIDNTGSIDTSSVTTSFGTSGIRGAASNDGSGFWAVGSGGGVIFVALGGATAGTVVSSTNTNNRVINVFNGQLYASASAGSFRLMSVGAGLPNTAGQTMVNLPGLPITGAPNAFYFADLDASVAGIDTLYLADDGSGTGSAGGGVKKFSLVSGNWAYNGTFPASASPSIPATSFFGLTGSVSGGTVTLYGTRPGTAANQIIRFIDATGYNVAPTAVPTVVATAAANTVFRGVALAPVSATAPDINLQGHAGANPPPFVSIANNDSTPSLADGTDFGSVNAVTGNITKTFNIQNLGTADLVLTTNPRVIIGGTNAIDFFVTGGEPTTPIEPTGASTFSLRFDPSTAGLKTATVTIANNDPDESPYIFTVQGMGTGALSAAIGTNNPAAASVAAGTLDRPVQQVRLSANGAENINVTQLVFTGSGTGNDATQISSVELFLDANGNGAVDGGEPQIGSSGTFSGDNGTVTFSGTPLLTVAANDSSNVLLRYDFGASASGTFSAAVSSAANITAAGATSAVALTPSGTFPINGNALTATAAAPVMTTTPGTLAFGNQSVGTNSSTQDVTINNTTGTAALNWSAALSGGDAAQFTIVGAISGSIPAGGSGTVSVRFSPASIGNKTANLVVSGNDAANPSDTISLTGTGVAPLMNVQGNSINIARNDNTPSTLDGTDFAGAAVAGDMVTATFTIQNTGNAPLTGISVLVGGTNASDFTVSTSPATSVSAGGSTSFGLTFDPSAPGLRSASVGISSNDPPAYTFAVQGTGVAPPQYRSVATGLWSDASTWEVSTDGGTVFFPAPNSPTSDDDTITVRSPHTVTVNSNITVDQVTIDSGATVDMQAVSNLTVGDDTGTDLLNNGTLTVSSGILLIQGQLVNNSLVTIDDRMRIQGTAGGTSTYLWGASGQLILENFVTPIVVDTGSAFWPDTNGPQVVRVQGLAGLQMNVPRTVTTFAVADSVMGAENLTLNGNVSITTGGSVTGSPTYGPASTLAYFFFDIYGRGDEWKPGAVAGEAGVPHDVTVAGNTTLDLPNGTTDQEFLLTGDLKIESGSKLTMAGIDPGFRKAHGKTKTEGGILLKDTSGRFGTPVVVTGMTVPLRVIGGVNLAGGELELSNVDGGDLYVGGDWNNNLGTLTNNTRTVFFNGSGAQAINGTTDFAGFNISTTSARTITFEAGATNAIHGTLTLTGAAGNLLSLRSSSDGNQWNFGASTNQNVDYVDVQDSNASFGNEITAGNSVDSGNNVNWIFGAAGSPEMNVTGNGQSIADGDSTPSLADHTAFGPTHVGNTVVRTFTIENTGTANLNLSGTPKVVVSGTNAADFSVTTDPTSPVAGAGSTTFQVTFQPSAGGVRTATISIDNNDADENPYNFSIQGSGTYTLSFNGNGSTGGTAPGAIDADSLVGVLGPGTLVRLGFQFVGWNTAADGSGTEYFPGQSFIIGADTTLFAQWAAPPCDPAGFDPDFGTAGKVITDIQTAFDNGRGVAIQADGKIVVAGSAYTGANYDVAVVRYNADGSLDTGFGINGKVTTDVLGGNNYGNAVAIQSDGKIVVAGNAFNSSFNYDFAIVRYNTDGSLDSTFDGDGRATYAVLGGDDFGNSLAIQPDGKIVVAGYSHNGSNFDFSVLRVSTTGVPDATFDGDGIVTAGILSNQDFGYSVALQSDGKIVVGGYTDNGPDNDFALMRFDSNGGPDAGFGTGGVVSTAVLSGDDEAYAIAIQGDGKIVAAGQSVDVLSTDFAVVRYNADGSPDSSFGTSGKVTTTIETADDFAESVAIQPDGKLVIAGYSNSGGDNDFAVVRLNTDGTPDTSFDLDGKAIINAPGTDDKAYKAVLQPDGRIVIAGDSYNGSDSDFYVVRLGGPCVPELNVKGNGFSIANGDPTPAVADGTEFGSTNIATGTVARTFTIENTGSADLSVGTPSFSGANSGDFSVTLSPTATPIVPGGSTTFQITFDPSATGLRTATVTVSNNAGAQNPFTFAIQGTGTEAFAVASTVPADGATAVALNSTISVTFNRAANPTTITTNGGTGTCSGTLQVSSVADNFSACVPLGSPAGSGGETTFTASPSSSLIASTTYLIRVTTGAQDSSGETLGAQFTQATGFATAGTPPAGIRYLAPSPTGVDTGACTSAGSPCATFTYAIGQAVAGDTVSIATGTYTQLGIVVDKNLTFVGGDPNAALTIVQANALPGAAANRVFTISSGVTVSMSNFTIQNGKAPTGSTGNDCTSIPCLPGSNGGQGQAGGGILNDGNLSLTNMTLSENRAGKGGTAGNITCPAGACNNIGGEGGTGGGVFTTGSLTVNSSSFTNNHAGEPGDAAVTVTCGSCSSTVGDTGNGGGLAGNTVSVDSSIFTGNSADDGAGILQGGAPITITNTTFTQNSASNTGGAINCNGSGTNTCTITGSTISDNFTSGTQGGTVAFFGSSVKTISNSTITGNDSLGDAGGILADFGTVNITFVTIADNVADANASGTGDGGGIKNEDATVNLKNSIIADNTDQNPNSESPQIWGTITSLGYNHVESTTGGVFTPTIGDVIGSEGGLAPLADNGGPTLTRGLYANSPSLDAIPNGTNGCGDTFAFDQRGAGFPRPVNGACDKGAFEGNLGTAPQEIDVQGGTPLVSIVDGDTTPSTTDGTDFGSTSAPVSHTFEIHNFGTSNLVVSNPVITGANFADCSVSSFPTSPVAPGGSTTFQVTFSPNLPGLRTAIVNIANNDPNEHPYDFAIQGTGVAATPTPTPSPSTLIVDTSLDDISMSQCTIPNEEDCSLRGAISVAQSGDTIVFASNISALEGVVPTITLAGSEIAITTAVNIIGPGADKLIIDGGAGPNRIFLINGAPLNITISGLSLTGGNGAGGVSTGIGGAIYAFCQLTLDGVRISQNNADNGGGVALVNAGPYTIRNSTINNNSALNVGGGISKEGSIAMNLTVVNSTISGNSVGPPTPLEGSIPVGGGIFANGPGNLIVRNSTITGNSAPGGGGIGNFGGSVSLGSSIVAGNSASPSGPEILSPSPGSAVSAGFNMIGDSAGDAANTGAPITYLPSDILDTNPLLGPLANNGGPTLTHKPQVGFAGHDKGCSFGSTTDQRGYGRSIDWPSVPDGTCTGLEAASSTDIGSVELLAPTAASATVSGRAIDANGRGLANVSVSLSDIQGRIVGTARTNSFGYFTVFDVPAGADYVIMARSKRYHFNTSSYIVSVQDNVTEILFVAE